MSTAIYALKLHESISLPCGLVVMRVPGGWLYINWDYSNDILKHHVFIPFTNEFQEST